MSKEYTKNLIALEDLVVSDTATQIRNGVELTLTGISAKSLACKDSKTILEYIEFLEARILALEVSNG